MGKRARIRWTVVSVALSSNGGSCTRDHGSITVASTGVHMGDTTAKMQEPGDSEDLLQTNHTNAFFFSQTETLALQLYDQLLELELQHSLLQAQQSGTSTSRQLPDSRG